MGTNGRHTENLRKRLKSQRKIQEHISRARAGNIDRNKRVSVKSFLKTEPVEPSRIHTKRQQIQTEIGVENVRRALMKPISRSYRRNMAKNTVNRVKRGN